MSSDGESDASWVKPCPKSTEVFPVSILTQHFIRNGFKDTCEKKLDNGSKVDKSGISSGAVLHTRVAIV
jgi:hypothetical protein